MICGADTYYISQPFPYIGKADWIEERLNDHILMKLISLFFNTGLNVTTESFFYKPFYYQEAQKTQNNRRNKIGQKDELYTSRLLFTGSENIIMRLYKVKEIKNVYLLSSMHSA